MTTNPKGCDPVITIKDLKNAFGDQVIHDGVNLTVCRGEILGVVGGSGTGKSVLLRSIIGLQTPESGEIEVLGENMIDRDEDEEHPQALGHPFPERRAVLDLNRRGKCRSPDPRIFSLHHAAAAG